MNHARANALAARQAHLLQRSAGLRASLALQCRPLGPALQRAERVHGAWQWLRANPQWPLMAGAALLMLRPGRTLRLAMRLWSWFGLAQQLRRALVAARR